MADNEAEEWRVALVRLLGHEPRASVFTAGPPVVANIALRCDAETSRNQPELLEQVYLGPGDAPAATG